MITTFLDIPVLYGLGIEVYFILFIIGAPAFFFCKWLCKKLFATREKREITTWAATISVTPLIYAALTILFISCTTNTPDSEFDKSQWLANMGNRFQMADNIIDNKLLIAKDTSQVKQMLGNPTWYNEWRTDTINTWSYDMGTGGDGLGFMFHSLVVKFDKGKVIAAEHIEVRD